MSTVSQGAAVAITAILDLQLRAESLETAHKVIHATLTDTRAVPGCPAHVVLYEKWESIEHDRAYRAWRASADALASNDLPRCRSGHDVAGTTATAGVCGADRPLRPHAPAQGHGPPREPRPAPTPMSARLPDAVVPE